MRNKRVSLALTLVLGLGLSLQACVSEPVPTNYEGGSSVISSGAEESKIPDLPFTEDGLLMASIHKIESPTRFIINKKSGQRLVMAGVEGPDKSEQPELYNEVMGWLLAQANERNLVFVRVSPGVDHKAKEIRGDLLVTEENAEGYLEMTQAMLSLGYLKIRDIREAKNSYIAERWRDTEYRARKQGLGIWNAKH